MNAVLHVLSATGLLVPEIKHIVPRTCKNYALFAGKPPNMNNILGYGALIFKVNEQIQGGIGQTKGSICQGRSLSGSKKSCYSLEVWASCQGKQIVCHADVHMLEIHMEWNT